MSMYQSFKAVKGKPVTFCFVIFFNHCGCVDGSVRDHVAKNSGMHILQASTENEEPVTNI